MAEAKSVPVLFVSDPIVLPGMVVPIALDDAARAAVDAARATESGSLLIAPRLDDRYPSYGVLASILQIGRVPGGGTAAVVRGERRAHIGTGASGPGAALWVEVTEVTDAEPSDETRALAAEYKKLLLAMLQRREAWELVEDGHLSEHDFAEFACGNVVRMLTSMNPRFFEGTVCEHEVAAVLAGAEM